MINHNKNINVNADSLQVLLDRRMPASHLPQHFEQTYQHTQPYATNVTLTPRPLGTRLPAPHIVQIPVTQEAQTPATQTSILRNATMASDKCQSWNLSSVHRNFCDINAADFDMIEQRMLMPQENITKSDNAPSVNTRHSCFIHTKK